MNQDIRSRCRIKKCWIILPYFFFDFLGTGLGSSETSSSSDGTKKHNIWLESVFLTVYLIDNCVIMSYVINLCFQRNKSPSNSYDRTNSGITGSFQYNQCCEQYSFPWFLFAIETKTSQELSFCSFPYCISYQLLTLVNQNLLRKKGWCRKWPF